MTSATEKRDNTIRSILDAAADSFAQCGFEGARMDKIADQAWVNKAMIYYHIGDKKALYARVLHDIIGGAAARFKETIDQLRTPEEKLKTMIHAIALTMDQHPCLAPIMLREQASGGRNLPEVIARDFAGIVTIVTDILDQGARQGVFIRTTPFIVHSMITGGMLFYKGSFPIRSRHIVFPEAVQKLGGDLSGDVAREIEKLVLKTIKK